MIIIGAIISSVIVYSLMHCYHIQNNTIGQVIHFVKFTYEDPDDYDNAKITCKSGIVVSEGDKVCVKLSDDTLIFIPKDKIFTKKRKLKNYYGMQLTTKDRQESI